MACGQPTLRWSCRSIGKKVAWPPASHPTCSRVACATARGASPHARAAGFGYRRGFRSLALHGPSAPQVLAQAPAACAHHSRHLAVGQPGDQRAAAIRPRRPSSSSAARSRMREVQRQAERLAARLHALGVKKGDRVMLDMQNCPQLLIAHFAILRANAVVVPVNPMNRAEELKHYIVDPDAKVAITTGDLARGDRQGQRAVAARAAAGAPDRHAVHRCLRSAGAARRAHARCVEGLAADAPPAARTAAVAR